MRKNFLIALLEEFNPKGIILNDERILEGVKPAFGSPGGKFFVAGKLVALFPEHDRYVEPFIGGGSVLFRKKKTENEFINDKDEEIIACYKLMQELTDQQLESLRKMDWKTNKETFNKLLAEYKESPNHNDPIYKFYRYVYIKGASDAGLMSSYDDRAEGEIMKLTERLMKVKERLAGVKIENMDYKDFVKKYSTESSFTFLDPPYPSAKMSWKWCPTQEEFESFTKTIPGKWMVTYEVCDGWKESKYNRKILSQYNLAAPSEGHMTRKSELLVSNYPMKENTSFLEAEIDIEDMKETVEFFSIVNLAEIYKYKESKSGNFALYHQWWKIKHLENKQLDSFIIATDLKIDLLLDKNPLNEDFKESAFYIKPANTLYEVMNIKENVSFIVPNTSLNKTERPSWIKVIDTGKISMLESNKNKLESIIKISGSKLNGIFIAKRESEISDFWTLRKKESLHKHSQCMECSSVPKYEVKWAEGMGHAWFCESHFKSWSAEHKDDIDYVKEIKDGRASERFAANSNPNIKDDILK